ncbi:MAG: hypothetical protein IPJ94_30690 [Chloroflexi bacterium]|nr:hypothetical protein [Chloroflexota bacterium]
MRSACSLITQEEYLPDLPRAAVCIELRFILAHAAAIIRPGQVMGKPGSYVGGVAVASRPKGQRYRPWCWFAAAMYCTRSSFHIAGAVNRARTHETVVQPINRALPGGDPD